MPKSIQEAIRTPNILDKKRNSFCYIKVKTTNTQNKETILKSSRGEGSSNCKGRPVRIKPDFLPETIKARRS